MAKSVTHAVEFRDPIQPDIGPDRYLLVFACDDGSIYEFQKMEDEPVWNLRSRGERGEHRSRWNTRRSPLPSDVKETIDELTDTKWVK